MDLVAVENTKLRERIDAEVSIELIVLEPVLGVAVWQMMSWSG